MKFLGVPGVFDYARLSGNSRYRSHSCCLPPLQEHRRLDCIFSELNTHPTYSPVYASPCTSRCSTQNSGPSRSLVLSREASTSSASCRFSPAHCNGLIVSVDHFWCEQVTHGWKSAALLLQLRNLSLRLFSKEIKSSTNLPMCLPRRAQ